MDATLALVACAQFPSATQVCPFHLCKLTLARATLALVADESTVGPPRAHSGSLGVFPGITGNDVGASTFI